MSPFDGALLAAVVAGVVVVLDVVLRLVALGVIPGNRTRRC